MLTPEELWRELAPLLRGLRNGAAYAAKVRLPHAIIMTLLFSRAPWRSMLQRISAVTMEHTASLATFVFAYKALMLLLRRTRGFCRQCGLPCLLAHLDGLVAGTAAAARVWTHYSNVHFQIVLYLLSRAMISAARIFSRRGVPGFRGRRFADVYPYLAAAVWGVIMWQYENEPATLQRSLRASMDSLYAESNDWRGPEDFAPSRMTVAVLLLYAAVHVTSGSGGDTMRSGPGRPRGGQQR